MSPCSAESETRETPRTPWYILTPARLVGGLLVVELVLLAINRDSGWLCLAGVAAFILVVLMGLLWFGIAILFHRRFQFGIKTLLTLMVVVAVVGGWFAWKWEMAKRQRDAIAGILNLEGQVWCDYRSNPTTPPESTSFSDVLGQGFFGSVAVVGISFAGTEVSDAWLRHLKGMSQLQSLDLQSTCVTDTGLSHLEGMTQLRQLSLNDTQITDGGLEHVKGLTQLRRLSLDTTQITDAGLEHIKGLPQLQCLSLDRTRITDAGLELTKGLTQLRNLVLRRTQVTDAGLDYLRRLTQLEVLSLRDTQVTDAGLEQLKGMSQLRHVDLKGTQVTQEGVNMLKQAIPDCEIDYDQP
jgi:uncharacterized protein YjbI with pentapeptide repeats